MSRGQRLAGLITALVLLVALVLVEVSYVWLAGDPKPTADRPVTVSDLAEATAVDAAGKSVAEILSTSYDDYDAQATQAESLMTESFALKYSQTSDDIKDAFIAAKTKVEMTVAWAGVYRASADQVQALLFLDQVVTKGSGGPTVTPYRALVTVLKTDKGWLVSDIETR